MSWLWLVLGITAACGDANGESGGSVATPSGEHSAYGLSCTIDDLVLEIPIELDYSVDRPLVAGATVALSFSAAIIFDEAFAAALIDAGVSKVDIMSMDISSWVLGATPSMVETSLAVGINDLDIGVDTDDNGAPGPHRLELDTVTATTSVDEDASDVELGLGLEGISLRMGDFLVPDDCLSPTLVGFAAGFPVELSR